MFGISNAYGLIVYWFSLLNCIEGKTMISNANQIRERNPVSPQAIT